MNSHLERALLLLQQSRHELAEGELRQVLAANPNDPHAHALLALCLAAGEKFQDATAEARQAIHLAPDFPFAHYVHARVLHDRRRNDEAFAAIQEALQLDPSDERYFALLSHIHLDEQRWADALAAAERGLQLDSEDVECTNLRAIALVKLGRKAEAGATIDAALAKNPGNSVTHANQGWTFLERGDPQKALEHFRESLRLDPQSEWARHGIVEALKARNFIYAIMLKYFLWMARLRPGVQWGIVLGGLFANQLLSNLAKSNPAWSPWITPIRIIYVAFVLMTWIAVPLFNLLLRLNRFGRLALSRDQTVASNWFGASLFLTLLSLAGCVAFGTNSPWLIAAVVFSFLLLPLAGTFRCEEGWPRKVMSIYTGALALIGLGALVFIIFLEGQPKDSAKQMVDLAEGLLGAFVIGAVGSTWLVSFLVLKRMRR